MSYILIYNAAVRFRQIEAGEALADGTDAGDSAGLQTVKERDKVKQTGFT
jgi:hypothetical protein